MQKMMTGCSAGWMAILLLFAVASMATADDVIHLKTGSALRGRIVEEDGEAVTIEIEGVGRMTLERSSIREIVRDVPSGDRPSEPAVSKIVRSEHAFLGSGDRRMGTRSVIVKELKNGGFSLEEEITFLDEDGKEEILLQIIEIVTASFDPVSIVYREVSPTGLHRLEGKVRDGKLFLKTSLPGEIRESSLKIPDGMRFPLAAREFVIRERNRIKGAWEVPVFDPREEIATPWKFSPIGKRKMDWQGAIVETLIIRRERSGRRVEEIWVDGDGRVLLAEINGPSLVATLSQRDRVSAFRKGARVAVSPEEARVRPVFTHLEAGIRVVKPNLSWSFDKPKGGDKKVLTISNVPRYFAYVDIFVLPEVPEGGLLSTLAVTMTTRFSSVSKEFKKLGEGYRQVGGEDAVVIEATSVNKGEDLCSMLVGVLHKGRTYLLAMACPKAYYKKAKPEFIEILDQFAFID